MFYDNNGLSFQYLILFSPNVEQERTYMYISDIGFLVTVFIQIRVTLTSFVFI